MYNLWKLQIKKISIFKLLSLCSSSQPLSFPSSLFFYLRDICYSPCSTLTGWDALLWASIALSSAMCISLHVIRSLVSSSIRLQTPWQQKLSLIYHCVGGNWYIFVENNKQFLYYNIPDSISSPIFFVTYSCVLMSIYSESSVNVNFLAFLLTWQREIPPINHIYVCSCLTLYTYIG